MVNSDLVIDFVNTAGFGPDREDLATPAVLAAWLSVHGLDAGARVGNADLEEARAVREALRDPFARTAHLMPLLELRAAQLRDPEPRRGLLPRYVSLMRGSIHA